MNLKKDCKSICWYSALVLAGFCLLISMLFANSVFFYMTLAAFAVVAWLASRYG
jgi:hypothetical protein